MRIIIGSILALLIFVCFISCEKNGITTCSTNNFNFEVSFLFEYEGIKVYRFYDGIRYHYFTSKGECIGCQFYQSGKARIYYDENI